MKELKYLVFFFSLLISIYDIKAQKFIHDTLIDKSIPGLDIGAGFSINQNPKLFKSQIRSNKLKFENKTVIELRLFFIKKESYKYGSDINYNYFLCNFDSVEFKCNQMSFEFFFEYRKRIFNSLTIGLGVAIGFSYENNSIVYKDPLVYNGNYFNRGSYANIYNYSIPINLISSLYTVFMFDFDDKNRRSIYMMPRYNINLKDLNDNYSEIRGFIDGFAFVFGYTFRFN